MVVHLFKAEEKETQYSPQGLEKATNTTSTRIISDVVSMHQLAKQESSEHVNVAHIGRKQVRVCIITLTLT
jgi:hypothetical protein